MSSRYNAVLFGLLLAGSAAAERISDPAHDESLGLEAYLHGSYANAFVFLGRALDEYLDRGRRGDVERVASLLVSSHWELGHDRELMDLADRYLPRASADLWYCRVLERRGGDAKAKDCYIQMGQGERERRAMRKQVLAEVFGAKPPPAYLARSSK